MFKRIRPAFVYCFYTMSDDKLIFEEQCMVGPDVDCLGRESRWIAEPISRVGSFGSNTHRVQISKNPGEVFDRCGLYLTVWFEERPKEHPKRIFKQMLRRYKKDSRHLAVAYCDKLRNLDKIIRNVGKAQIED